MNLKKRFSTREKQFYIKDSSVVNQLSDVIHSWLTNETGDLVVLCIGTDRSTGDSLGPLTGTLLQNKSSNNFTVYGTLDHPIHAVNLRETIDRIHAHHFSPYIIAIDACLGRSKSIGSIITDLGPLKPGAALKKDLPSVGNIHISGVVNISGYMEYLVLQNTRLHLVMQMAQKISDALHLVDLQLKKDGFINKNLSSLK